MWYIYRNMKCQHSTGILRSSCQAPFFLQMRKLIAGGAECLPRFMERECGHDEM